MCPEVPFNFLCCLIFQKFLAKALRQALCNIGKCSCSRIPPYGRLAYDNTCDRRQPLIALRD